MEAPASVSAALRQNEDAGERLEQMVKEDKRKIQYTAYDRDLIKAAARKHEITFWLVGFLPFADEVKGLYCLFATPVSVEEEQVKVSTANGRDIWLNKDFIMAVEMRGKT